MNRSDIAPSQPWCLAMVWLVSYDVFRSVMNRPRPRPRPRARRWLPIPPQVADGLDFRSDQVTRRLDCLGGHYRQLEQLLAELEARLPEAATPTFDPPRRPR
jgi:hypothetical protein